MPNGMPDTRDLMSVLMDKVTQPELPELPPSPMQDYTFRMDAKPEHYQPKVAVKDYRDVPATKGFTGKYPASIIQELVHSAKQRGLDPNMVLAMGLQESNLGTAGGPEGGGNPLMVSQALSGAGPSSKWPSDTLLGTLEDSAVSRDARNALDREYSIPTALAHLQKKLQQHPDNTERGLQAYNGLGKPDNHIVKNVPGFQMTGWTSPTQKMYGVETSDLPQNFYGKRIMELMEKVVKPNAVLQAYTKD